MLEYIDRFCNVLAYSENTDKLIMPDFSSRAVIEYIQNQDTTSKLSIIVCMVQELTEENRKILDDNVAYIIHKGRCRRQGLVQLTNNLKPTEN
ncbi:hypothetical protein [Methanohalophilus profundi]|uniref:hypothetical protein n=1 Tax=Methanohalophilus profundi TaxID=2138083 RepID=UPI00101D0A40|nr:hypothetical protein [Methanohalophilus profundi]